LYRQLESSLRRAIIDRDLPPGTRLPAERELARSLAVSRTTTSAAYQALKQGGWLESREGGTTRVRESASRIGTGEHRPEGRRENGDWYLHADLHSHLPGERRLVDLSASGFRGFMELPPGALTLEGSDIERAVSQSDGYAPFGLPRLRNALARRLTAQGLRTTPEQLLITGGAQQAINLIVSQHVRTDEAAILENPTYFGAIDSLRGAGARMIGLPVDRHGVDPGNLAAVLQQRRVSLMYLVLSFHNPTGAVTPDGVRREIARIVELHGVPTIDDVTFANQVIDAVPPPPLATYSDADLVLTIGSLSTLFGGGLRVGWVRATPPIIARLARLKLVADLGTSVPSQLLAASLLDHAEAVNAARAEILRSRRAALVAALSKHLPDWSYEMPSGGVFLWARLPFGDSAQLAQMALRAGVRITPSWPMSVDRTHTSFVRLPLIDEDSIHTGIELLGHAWQRYRSLPNIAPQRMAV
jgi:DNA-binding transcriptional MocR family regulator